MKLKVKLEEGAILQKNNAKDSGFDVAAWRFCEVKKSKEGKRHITTLDVEEITLMPMQRIFVDTGVSAEWDSIHNSYYSGESVLIDTQIRGRSGLNLDGLLCQFGTIDEIYRGRVGATLINLSGDEIVIRKGDRIGQIVIGLALSPKLKIVKELSETERGSKGFGSSDIKGEC